MKGYQVIIALVNGMLGGVILILPVMAMHSGTVLSLIVILVTGSFSYYSCLLCIKHLGEHSDLDQAILNHFKDKKQKVWGALYDFLVGINLFFLLMLYFSLIVIQWQGFVGNPLGKRYIIPIANGVFLIILTVLLKYFYFGAKLLAFGIISIIVYCLFLIWLVADRPLGSKTINTFASGGVDLIASMGQAFAIQTFFIPVLRQMKDETKYKKYLIIIYLIGGSVYLFVAYAGSFGIVNRIPFIGNAETIEGYFSKGSPENIIIGSFYLVHLYSAFGEFLLICKKRLFGLFRSLSKGFKLQFEWIQSGDGKCLQPYQILFIIVLIVLITLTSVFKVKIDFYIEINSAFIGFFYIYLLPAVIHIRCLYFSGTQKENEINMIERSNAPVVETFKEVQKQQQNESLNKSEMKEKMMELRQSQRGIIIGENDNKDSELSGPSQNKTRDFIIKPVSKCKCVKSSSKIYQIIDIGLIICMCLLGTSIMIIGMKRVIQNSNNE